MKAHTTIVIMATMGVLPVLAQPENQFRSWFGHISGGFVNVIGAAGDVVDDGWDFNVGATFWPRDWGAGLTFELGYNDSELRDDILALTEASGSRVEVWNLTLGTVWGRKFSETVGFEVGVAAGAYTIEGALTEPGLYIGPICDPWLWYCYRGIVPGDVVTDSYSTTRLGYNASVGLTFDLGGSGTQLLLQARYNRAETSRVATEFVPFNIGFRF